MPIISVIVPVYNVYNYLDRCIKSVLNQTFTCFELILIAGNSTDGSTEKCAYWKKKDKRIRLIMQAEKGLGSARNLGIKEAYASIIAFLDADDWWDHSILEKMYAEMKRTDADMVMCDRYNVYYNKDESNYKKQYLRELAMEDSAYTVIQNPNLIRTIEVSVNGKIYRKELFIENQIWQPNVFGEDRAIMYFLISKCKRIGKVREALYYYHCARNGNSVGNAKTYATTAECMQYIFNLFLQDNTIKKYKYQLNWIFKTIAEIGIEGLSYPCLDDNFDKNKAVEKIKNFLNDYQFDKYGKRYIWGSYNLRRMVWLALPQLEEKRVHFCYSSIISAMSSKIEVKEIVKNGNRDKDRWCKNDFQKLFYESFRPNESDVLFIDLLEERLPVVQYQCSYFTFSSVTKQMAYLLFDNNKVKTINFENKEKLWKEKCIDFIDFLKKRISPQQVVLVKMKLSDKYGDYQGKKYFKNQKKIKKINSMLENYYQFFEENFAGINVIDCCMGEYFYTDKKFNFGCYPWHLNENFYIYHAEKIERLLE